MLFHSGHANGQKNGHKTEITDNYDTCTLQETFGDTSLWIMLMATWHIPDIIRVDVGPRPTS